MDTAAGQGRPVTPKDLHARRARYEQCAALSPEAALLAVLVDRIGELERIVVRPGELIDGLRKRLDARDVRAPLTARLLGSWLRRLGFSTTGRVRCGLQYEIRWEQLWKMDPREVGVASTLDVRDLSGPQLLRLLAQEGNRFFAPHIWCPRCHGVTAILWERRTAELAGPFRCPACHGTATILEDGWLKQVFQRIRRAIREDRDLLAQVKTEWEEIHDRAPFPQLPEPYGWFNLAWEKAGRGPGRPSCVLVRYELAHMVGRLESAGLSAEEIEGIFLEHAEARRLQLYDNFPERVHRFLGEKFRDSIGTAPVVSRREQLWQRVHWAKRQWTNPRVRLNGEKGAASACIW